MTKKIKYFVGNWKMFGDFNSFKIIYKINKFCANSKKTLNKKKVVLCVPNTLLYYFKNKLRKKIISLGAQNCHHNSNYGAFTGSINASMLKKTLLLRKLGPWARPLGPRTARWKIWEPAPPRNKTNKQTKLRMITDVTETHSYE